MSWPSDNGDRYVTRREWDQWHEAHLRAHEAERRAIDKADQDMDRRLEGMNEFRDQLREQAGTFLTRDTADARFTSIDTAMDLLATRIDAQERWRAGIDGRTIGITAAIGIAVIVINVMLRFLV